MCLIVKKIFHLNGKPKIAKRDIMCYKVMSMSNDYMHTPYQNCCIHSKHIQEGLHAPCFQHKPVYECGNGYVENAIHTYRKYKYAFKNAYSRLFIIRAYIPKGAKYWIGRNGEYASESIQFN